ncbi:ROK family protein [Echinicola soli]|uniref:ROK family protein n=1 Tax=Echinicola soli TaxID=2591634 RepID=A0A514CL15_9BACT|nr:ROK family protein [Echinicola soli]QDH80525.1 ROK family protein [Echinicola soli]
MKIGIDLGGTKVQIGLEENGAIVRQQKAFLNKKDNLEATLTQLKDFIRPFISPGVSGIGIGVPSVVDTARGIVYNVTNIPAWEKVHLRDILEAEFQLPVMVNNDVNCFVLGEHRFGIGKSFRNIVGICIGTGLGAGLVLGDQLYMGHNCGAGEIGLVPYLDHNIEYYASGNFFSALYDTTALEAFHAATAGDQMACRQWEEFGQHFGKSILAVLYTYDPEAIIIGGSISKAYPFFSQSLQKTLTEFIYPESFKRLKILISENENIPMLGAAALTHLNLSR